MAALSAISISPSSQPNQIAATNRSRITPWYFCSLSDPGERQERVNHARPVQRMNRDKVEYPEAHGQNRRIAQKDHQHKQKYRDAVRGDLSRCQKRHQEVNTAYAKRENLRSQQVNPDRQITRKRQKRRDEIGCGTCSGSQRHTRFSIFEVRYIDRHRPRPAKSEHQQA